MNQRIARIESTTLGYEDHGILTAMLHVTYGGSGQGIGGLMLDQTTVGTFIVGVLRACGVGSWEEVRGRTVLVLLEDDGWNARPIGLAPLPTEPGDKFMFDEIGRKR